MGIFGYFRIYIFFYIFFFYKQKQDALLCSQVLTKEQAALFEHAVLHHYWYQMYVDDLPVWGMVGEIYEHPLLNDEEMKKKEEEDEEEKKTMENKNKKNKYKNQNKLGSGGGGVSKNDDEEEEEEERSPFKLYVYTRKIFSIAYNQQRIVEVNLTSEGKFFLFLNNLLLVNIILYVLTFIENNIIFFLKIRC